MADLINPSVDNTAVTDVNETIDNNDTDIDNTDIDDTELDETDSTDVDETPETEEGEETEEDNNFDPDNLEFEESEDYTFGDYNLSKFKDSLDFTNEAVREGFNNLSKELKEQGFTQAQIEWLMEKEISAAQNKRNFEPSKEQVIKELKENLSIQERRDYKAVGSFLKDNLKGTEIEKYYKEAMANPAVFKIVHALYSKNMSGKPIETGSTKTSKEDKGQKYTIDNAVDEYTEYLREHIGDREDRKPVINKILSKLSKENQIIFKKQFGI